ncbi:uncharacterized protein LOC124137142 [Haliotis rufescens]|uniref:uncharacterized protein LOC124137142 n=1 Tax=Haliotis rufescens TaxID=6454 RepID=UPI001EAFD79E|nr:uncharacterized protein LOC124137142 [Haliotis rufescens]
MGIRIVTSVRTVIVFILPCLYFTHGNICPTASGEKVVHVCEDNFASGASIYLDTFKAVNYEGNCLCDLRAQGGAVDLQLSVQGVHKDCDAILYFPPPIDYTYKCADKASSNTTGRIGPGQVVFLTLVKRSEVTDFCVHLVQISSAAGSLNLACFRGTLKSANTSTTTSPPINVTSSVTTSDTSVTEGKDSSGDNTTTTATESKDSSGDNTTTTATESKDSPGDNTTTTVTESKDSTEENPHITPSGITGHNNTATPQSVIGVSFVVVGVVAAIVP